MDKAFEVTDAPEGLDGLVVVITLDGKRVPILYPREIIRDIIRAFGQKYTEQGQPAPTHGLGRLLLAAPGISQDAGTTNTQVLLSTELGQIVLEADTPALLGLRDQIDRVLALRGGSKTVQ